MFDSITETSNDTGSTVHPYVAIGGKGGGKAPISYLVTY